MDFISKFMPAQVRTLLQDKTVVNDLVVVLSVMSKSIDAACKDPATDKDLKKAFNDTATMISAADTYLRKGSLSYSTMAKLAYNKNSYEKSIRHLMGAFQSGDATVTGMAKSIRENCDVIEAVKRISIKTNGNLFCLECGADGQGYAVELITGNSMRIPLEKADYMEIKNALDAAKNPPPAPKHPPAPGV